MCNQTVGLVAAELERQGIATVAIQLLRHVAERVRAPRALLVPFPHGHPLGEPEDPELQHAVVEAALQVLEDEELSAPALVEFDRRDPRTAEPDSGPAVAAGGSGDG